mmetsp:Transcript_30370/g.98743  ORF Transcript_30370/g.98743 Transcript_30370/m.98743 type:complete len:311 (+) Transcript_30370:979-1911(+)
MRCARAVASAVGVGGRIRARASISAAAAAAHEPSTSDRICHVSLITGASRGLGLEVTRQLLEAETLPKGREGGLVFAAARNPSASAELLRLRERHPERLTLVTMDITDESSITAAAESVSAKLEEDGNPLGIHLLMNVAGVLHTPTGMAPETRIANVDPAHASHAFAVNALGPLLVCKGFEALLREAAKEGVPGSGAPAVVANLSARVGSIADNNLGGWISYRSSKAALNQMTRTVALEWARRKPAGPVCIALHPGTCDTDLSAPFQRNVPKEKLFSRERGARQLLDVVGSLGRKDTGVFLDWAGKRVEW